jgi:parvulin-like peptidyl-prolyl isomerase
MPFLVDAGACLGRRSFQSPRAFGIVALLVFFEAGASGPLGAQEPAAAAPKAVQPAAATPEALPPGVLARLNGRDITVDEYARYLLDTLGKSELPKYVDRLLLDAEAARLGIQVTAERVDELVEEQVEREVRGLYRGDRARLEAELEKARLTLTDYKARLRQELRYDLLVQSVVSAGRELTDAPVRVEFERIYGKDGTESVLRQILVATGSLPGGTVARTDTEAKTRAQTVLAELRQGGDFVQATRVYSDDPYTRQNEGRLPHYRTAVYGDSFDTAVRALSKESPLSGVVPSKRGYHIIELLDRRTVRFEEVAPDLREALKNRAVTLAERQALVRRLRAAAEIEGL